MLKVKIARTWEDQEKGLSGIDYLAPDEGMLFEFHSPRRLSFWGKETYIPLDIAFITGEIITKIAHIEPLNLHTVTSDIPANIAIEANSGYFAKNGIKVGDHIDVTDRLQARLSAYMKYELDADRCIIRFRRGGHIIEGAQTNTQKDIEDIYKNQKVSQTLAPEAPMKVEKPSEKRVGDPIGEPTPEQTDVDNLPVLDPSEIGSKMEDAFDEEEEFGPAEEAHGYPQEAEPFEEQQGIEEQQQVPEEEYPVFTNPFAAAEWAQQNDEVLRISYTTTRGRQLTRDVEPHGQFHSKSTHRQILVTWDRTIGDIRAFILQNIGSWAFTGQQFQKKFIVRG